MLEPLNNFLYTWTFLETLEHNYQGGKKKFCRVFKIVSIILVPFVYFVVFFSLLLVVAKADMEQVRRNYGLATKFDDLSAVLFKVLGYWTTFTNIVCCAILGLVIRFVKKITRDPLKFAASLQSEELEEKVGLNIFVTVAHIVIIFAYTVVLFVGDNFESKLQVNALYRSRSALIFFSTLLDIFIAYMMWFIADDAQNTPAIVRDENVGKTYQVLDLAWIEQNGSESYLADN
jgi:hypothetical protein